MRQLNWIDPGHAVHRVAINHLESTLGVHFPADFVQFASKFYGANNPDECTFEFSENDGSTRIGDFGAVLDAEGDDTESVIATLNNLDSQLPKTLFRSSPQVMVIMYA